jgi:hypothetical protein
VKPESRQEIQAHSNRCQFNGFVLTSRSTNRSELSRPAQQFSHISHLGDIFPQSTRYNEVMLPKRYGRSPRQEGSMPQENLMKKLCTLSTILGIGLLAFGITPVLRAQASAPGSDANADIVKMI